jgi:Ca-activated chloride channel family protein
VLLHSGPKFKTFALTVRPPAALLPSGPREVIFLLDGLRSLAAPEREALGRCLEGLRPADSFIMADARGRARPVPATAGNLAAARNRLRRLKVGRGGTAERLARVLELPADPGRARRLVLVTDGRSAAALAPILGEHLGPARLLILAAGEVVDRRGLEMLAAAGRGAAVGTGDPSGLSRMLEGPAVTDLRVDWGTLAARELCPAAPGELFPGRPLILTGRAAGGGRHRVTVSGRAGGREFRRELVVDLDAPGAGHPGVEKLWQLRRLLETEDAELAAPGPEARRRVLETALRHGLVSRYTAFLTVDTLTRAAGERGQ